MIKKAMFFDLLTDQQVQCRLCAHACRIKSGERGVCGVRENRAGILYSLNYGMVVAENVDPIEKKPLFHLCPGSLSYSLATVGCNFHCLFCQNHEISQLPRETGEIVGRTVSAAEVVDRAVRSGAKTIAYTYTEPTVFFEYAYDIALLAHERGIGNVFVTNGYMSRQAVDAIAPYLDAANVDLKSFREGFYRKQCGARLQPVLDTISRMKELGIWVEVTTLLIPGLNDNDEEIEGIADFLCSIGTDIPWHISRFHPRYQMPAGRITTIEGIRKAADIGRAKGLKYVYSGNVPGERGESTFCSYCGNLLVRRYGFHIESLNLKGSACPDCATPLEGLFQGPIAK
jgi:pyruvate formate lyase activating enzyme